MNQNRKDRSADARQSSMKSQPSMKKGDGSRDSVLGSAESFEHGSGPSEMARGMGSSTEREMPSGSSESRSRTGISNRGFDEERHTQERVPERGRSQSEE